MGNKGNACTRIDLAKPQYTPHTKQISWGEQVIVVMCHFFCFCEKQRMMNDFLSFLFFPQKTAQKVEGDLPAVKETDVHHTSKDHKNDSGCSLMQCVWMVHEVSRESSLKFTSGNSVTRDCLVGEYSSYFQFPRSYLQKYLINVSHI